MCPAAQPQINYNESNTISSFCLDYGVQEIVRQQQSQINDLIDIIHRQEEEIACLKEIINGLNRNVDELRKSLDMLSVAHEDLENAFVINMSRVNSTVNQINQTKQSTGPAMQNRMNVLRSILAANGSMMLKDVRKMMGLTSVQMSKLLSLMGDDIVVERSKSKKNAKVIRLSSCFRETRNKFG